MNLKLEEDHLRASYRDQCAQYRKDDEIEVTSAHHRRIRGILRDISRSFGRPIRVLEAGCGTGRYFHCLENVDDLIGVDLSPEMLEAARNPVCGDEVTVRNIELLCESVFDVRFDPSSFDFIYSFGMFGFACPVTVEICNRFHNWLRPGGKLFFNVIDRGGWPIGTRLRRSVRDRVYEMAPRSLRQRLDARTNGMAMHDMTRRKLESLMRKTPFRQFRVESRVCLSPLWQGSHLECLAEKQMD